MQSRMVYFEFSLLIIAFLCISFLSKSKGMKYKYVYKLEKKIIWDTNFWQNVVLYPIYTWLKLKKLFRYTCNKFSIKWNIYSHNLYEPFDSKFRPRWWTWWFFSMFEIFFVLFERIWNTTSYNVFLFVRNWKFRGYINWIYQKNRLGTRAIHVSNRGGLGTYIQGGSSIFLPIFLDNFSKRNAPKVL